VIRGPLHVRPDEEPDVDFGHFIDREICVYPGCRICGHEDHRQKDCPNQPYAKPKRPKITPDNDPTWFGIAHKETKT
jgi:hypothetical protein